MAYRYVKNIRAGLKQLADNNVWEIVDSGAPTDGTSGTGVNFAGPGSVYIDTSVGTRYVNTGTAASPAWKLVVTEASSVYGVFAAGTAASGTGSTTSIAVTGALTTDVVNINWHTAPQTIQHIVAAPTTNAVSITYVTGTVAAAVGTAGVLQYTVFRAL